MASVICHATNYAVETPNGVTTLLHNITLNIKSGEMVAVMGPSGSGKTTLLDLISGRRRFGVVTGSILVNNRRPDITTRHNTAYVLQDDFHMACLTVKETLTYAVRLRCGLPHHSKEETDRVTTLITMLGLTGCQNVVVGNQLIKGISGGQLRRLSIGVEVVLLPDLVCLDEPTSGLDSSTALEIVNAIKAFTLGTPSSNGIITKSTVLCTIHQPSPAQFLQFDRLVLLAPAGHLLFSGTIPDAIQFFTQTLKFDYIPSENPAEFFLEVAVGKRFPRGTAGPYELETLVAAYSKRREKDGYIVVNNGNGEDNHQNSIYPEKLGSKYDIIMTLIHREWRATIWNKPYMFAQMQAQFLSALIVGIVFFQQAIPAQNANTISKQGGITDDCYNTLGALFLGLTLATRPNIAAIPEIFASKILYKRESETGAYDSFLYSIAVVIGRIPLLLIKTFLFITIIYFMVGYTLKFHVYLLFFTLTAVVSWVSLSYAMWLAAYCSTPMVALGLYPPAFSILSFFSGYQIHFSDLPIWFKHWMPWFSYVRYAYEGLVKNEFHNYDDHHEVYKEYDFQDDGVTPGTAIVVLFLWVIIMTVLFYLALKPSKTLLKWEVSITNGTTNPLQTSVDESQATLPRYSQSIRDGSTFFRQIMERGSQQPADLDRSRRTAHNLGSIHSMSNILMGEVSRHTITELPQDVVQYNDPFTLTRDSIARRSSQLANSPTPLQAQNIGIGLQLNFDIQSLNVFLPEPTTGVLTPKCLLNSVKGTVNSREIVAIMGPSGAGKTTLLDVLSGRLLGTTSTSPSKGEFQLTGSINVISPVTNKYQNAESCIGYVTQQSNLNPYLTVANTLAFAAEMRMPIDTSPTTRSNRVTQLLEMLQLNHVATSYVGGVGATVRGVTRGQRKRLGIAIEIINLPDIIFLDEPTTGLDALLALDVITCACDLAQTNRIVLSTIHLPSKDIFNLFSRLILLSDGYVIYNGPAKQAEQYFISLGYTPTVLVKGADINPADFVIDVASHQLTTETTKANTAAELSQIQIVSPVPTIPGQLLELNLQRDGQTGKRVDNTFDFRMTWILMRRYWKAIWNEGREIRSSVDRHVLTGLIHGLVFWQLKADDSLARSSLLYFNAMFLVMNNEQCIPRIFEAKPLRLLEISSKLYSSSTYWLSLVLATTPLTLFYSFLFIAIMYPMAGLRWGAQYFFFNYLISAIGSLSGLYLCQLLAATYPTPPLAISKYTTLAAFLMGFSGYLVRLPTLPDFLYYWAPFISFFRWSYQPLFLNEFSDDEDLISDYGFQSENKWESFGIQIIFMMFFLFATWYTFRKN